MRSPLRSLAFVILAAVWLVPGCGSDVNEKTETPLDGELYLPPDTPETNPDATANCNSTNASSGASCTQDCIVGCGFERLGTKVCSCVGGVYSQCPCFKPPTYGGAPTAPMCDTPDGTTTSLNNQPCTQLWQQCIGTDAVSGATPRGCVCYGDEGTGQMLWSCGSTNRWFRLEGT